MSRMLQPTKQTLRQTIAHAADTLAAKNEEIDRLAEQLDAQFWKGAALGAAAVSLLLGGVWWLS